MKFFVIVSLLGGSLPLLAQQQGTTYPLEITPAKPATTVDPNKVVLQVGDTRITAQQLDDLIDVYPAATQIFLRGPGKQQFADTVTRMLVLAGEARKRKMDQTEKFKEQIQFSEANLLAAQLSQRVSEDVKVDEPRLRKFFEDHRCEYQTWRARQILVRATGSPLPVKPGEKDLSDEEALAKAQDVRKRLVGGADFAELARAESDDTTGANGGEIGQVRHGSVAPSFEEALCKMNAGELSQPVKTQFGYHIIELESKEAKGFDDVKAELEQRVRPEAAKQAIDDMIAKTKVVKDPEYYGDAPAPAASKNK